MNHRIKVTRKEQIKILNNKIKANNAQYNLDRENAEISAFSEGDLEKYEYLTRKDLKIKPNALQKAKFEFSPLCEAFSLGLDKTAEGYQEEGVIKLLKDIRDGLNRRPRGPPGPDDEDDNGDVPRRPPGPGDEDDNGNEPLGPPGPDDNNNKNDEDNDRPDDMPSLEGEEEVVERVACFIVRKFKDRIASVEKTHINALKEISLLKNDITKQKNENQEFKEMVKVINKNYEKKLNTID